MNETESVGKGKLSKTSKAIMLFFDDGKTYMIPVSSMRDLMAGKKPYIRIRKFPKEER